MQELECHCSAVKYHFQQLRFDSEALFQILGINPDRHVWAKMQPFASLWLQEATRVSIYEQAMAATTTKSPNQGQVPETCSK